ncbi:MAG: hypothetical protein GX540_04370 [Clostridiales bacterium]|nr:hypothetical protein [Clostridiales bacterium]
MANDQIDMNRATGDQMRQYRKNAETVMSIMTILVLPKEMITRLCKGLIEQNSRVDMKTADIAVQEQYRLNAEMIVQIINIGYLAGY